MDDITIYVGDAYKTPLDEIKLYLKKYQSRGFNAVVAGGWVRDIYLGVTPKDVDVFIPKSDQDTYCGTSVIEDVRYSVREDTGVSKDLDKVVMKTSRDYMETTNFRDDVFSVVKYEDDYDFISVKLDVVDLVAGFDCSICQIWLELDDQNKLIGRCLGDFMDAFDMTINFYKDVELREAHKERLEKKFPNFQWDLKESCDREVITLGELTYES